MKPFWCSLVLVAALIPVASTPTLGGESNRPNIVFIFADDWGWGDLSCHGSDVFQTPNLDRLAADGTDFHQFTVNSPVCSPSRTALLTGQFPGRHSVHQHFASVAHHERCGMPDWLDPEAPLLPRMLQDAGYATAHYGKWHLTNRHVPDAPYPDKYGYDEYGAFNVPGPQIEAGTSCDHAIDFIRRHRDKPFFVNVWIHETHTPHYPTEPSLARFAHLGPQQQVYAAVIADGDERVGRLLAALDELELTEDTLVIFSSDNGPEITGRKRTQEDNSTGPGLGTFYSVGETGGLRGRKRSLLAGGVRTPFLVRWPSRVAAGAVNTTTAITAVDMLPTLLDAAGVDTPSGYVADGESMLPALLGVDFQREKPIYWEWPGNHRGDNWPHLGVRRGQWKLLINQREELAELFDLEADPTEARNLAESHPDVVEQLTEEVLAWRGSLPTEANPACFSGERASR